MAAGIESVIKMSIASTKQTPLSQRKRTEAHLYLNGKQVGLIQVRGSDNSWAYGEFVPGEAFVEFAPMFGQWSLLMHFDGDEEPLSEAAAEELRRAEYAIDSLKARIFFPETGQWHAASQVNIDGPMIEWKEGRGS